MRLAYSDFDKNDPSKVCFYFDYENEPSAEQLKKLEQEPSIQEAVIINDMLRLACHLSKKFGSMTNRQLSAYISRLMND